MTYEEIIRAYNTCKPFPAYLECHPRDLYEMLNSPEFYDRYSNNWLRRDDGEFYLSGVLVKTHPYLKGWRVVARPWQPFEHPDEMETSNKPPLAPGETRSTKNIQSDDFNDSERNEHEKKRAEYEKQRVNYRRLY